MNNDTARSEGAKSARMAAAEGLNPREAVSAFAAWMTTRDDTITIGASHEVPPIPQLVKAFCDSQGLALVRDDFADRIAPYPES